MTNVVTQSPRIRLLDNNGTPIPLGLVFVYQPASTTKITSYQDQSNGMPNTNPIQLDYRSECDLWLPPGTAYKLVLAMPGDTDPPTNPIWTRDNLTSDQLGVLSLTQAQVGTALYPQTAAELAAAITPTVYYYPPGDVRRYGATIVSSDNTVALQAAINQAAQTGGAEVYVPPGNWNFASTTAAVCPIPGSNVTIRGAGKTTTTLTVTGTAITAGFFNGSNLSNIRISDLAIVGNNKATPGNYTDGGAIYLRLTSAAVAQIGNYHIERCAFTNFQANYWINVTASGGTVQNFGVTTIRVKDCDFTSKTGNAQNGASVLYPAHCIACLGGTTPAATIYDVEVSGCTADCTYIKGFFINWGGLLHVNVHHNTIKNVGTSAQLSDDSGCYALTAYQNQHYAITGISAAASAVVTAPGHGFINGDYVFFTQIVDAGYNSGVPSVAGTLMAAMNWKSFGPISGVSGSNFTIPLNSSALSAYTSGGAVSNLQTPDFCEFSSNTIDGVRDAGIYLASTNRITISNNIISGQTSTVDGTIPKGAICLNQDLLPTLDDNKIYNCAIGIAVVTILGVSQNIRNTAITAIPASGVGMKISPSGTGCVGEVIIDGLKIETSAASVDGVRFLSNSSVGLATFELRNFKITGVSLGVRQYSTDASVPALGNVRIFNGLLGSFTNTGLYHPGCSNAGTRTVIGDIVFSNPVVGSIMINVSNSLGLTVRNLTFNDMTSGVGYAWAGGGAQGRLVNLQYNNVAAGNRVSGAGSEFGIAVPAWTAADNDYVQNLDPTVTGTGGFGTVNQKRWTAGWTWDRANAAWAPDVRLTGT